MPYQTLNKRIVGLLTILIILGVAVRYFPIAGTRYPIGFDAGPYYGRAKWHEKTWPLLPEDISYFAEADEVVEPTPLLSWLTAAWIKINSVLGVDSYQAMKVFPILVYLLIASSLILLSREIVNKKNILALSVLFFSFSAYDLMYTYTGFVCRTHFSTFIINLLFLFCIRTIKSTDKNEKWRDLPRNRHYVKNSLIASFLLVILFLVQLDQGPFALTIIAISFFVGSMIKFKNVDFKISAGLIIPYLLGVIFSIPIFYWKREFILGRINRLLLTSGIHMKYGFIENFGSALILLLFVTVVFSILGYFFIADRLRRDEDNYGLILVLSWFTVMIFLTLFSVFVGNVVLSASRYLAFSVIPISILASFGVLETGAKITKRMKRSVILSVLKTLLLIILICYLFAVSIIATRIPSHVKSFLNESHLEGMNWIKEETSPQSVIFCYNRSPWHLAEFIPGITGRQIIIRKLQVPIGNYSKEGELNMKAETILRATDIEAMNSIIRQYPDSYLVVGKKTEVLEDAGISLSRLDRFFGREFENNQMIIYKLEFIATS